LVKRLLGMKTTVGSDVHCPKPTQRIPLIAVGAMVEVGPAFWLKSDQTSLRLLLRPQKPIPDHYGQNQTVGVAGHDYGVSFNPYHESRGTPRGKT
jgi:hypothetical protein